MSDEYHEMTALNKIWIFHRRLKKIPTVASLALCNFKRNAPSQFSESLALYNFKHNAPSQFSKVSLKFSAHVI